MVSAGGLRSILTVSGVGVAVSVVDVAAISSASLAAVVAVAVIDVAAAPSAEISVAVLVAEDLVIMMRVDHPVRLVRMV